MGRHGEALISLADFAEGKVLVWFDAPQSTDWTHTNGLPHGRYAKTQSNLETYAPFFKHVTVRCSASRTMLHGAA